MEEYQEKPNSEITEGAPKGPRNRWLIVVAVLVVCAAVIAAGYAYREQATVSQLTSHEEQMNAVEGQMQDEIGALTSKMDEMASAQQAAAAAAETSGASSADARRAAAEAKRLKQLQSEVSAQKSQLKDTQDLVAKNREELEGNISSTRDELTGSIARTHDELVALEKRGDRNFFEFDIAKSKRFVREGPIELSLRKADPKHKSYSLAMLVDDNQLMKKNVNLYEPIWIHRLGDPQPAQVVVNKIGKNSVHGYVSAPKYSDADLAAKVAPGAPAPSGSASESPASPGAVPAPAAGKPAGSSLEGSSQEQSPSSTTP